MFSFKTEFQNIITFKKYTIMFTRLKKKIAVEFSQADSDLEKAYNNYKKKIFIVFFTGLFSPLFLFFAIEDVFSQNYIEAILSFVVLGIILVLTIEFNKIKPIISYRIVFFVLMTVLIFWFIDGGSNGEKMLWLYLFPTSTIFFFTIFEGLIWNAVMALTLILLLLFHPRWMYFYPAKTIVRFAITYFTSFMLVILYEIARLNFLKKIQDNQSLFRTIHRELQVKNTKLQRMNSKLQHYQFSMDTDMKMASLVQSTFLPQKAPEVKGWEIAFFFKPMFMVSGDFFDLYVDRDGFLHGAALFDVSGHGIAPGLISMVAKSLIFRKIHTQKGRPLGEIVHSIDHTLGEELAQTRHYLAGLLLAIKDESITLVNAGHVDPLIKKAKDGRVKTIALSSPENRNTFLGANFKTAEFEEIHQEVEKGDTILLFTDCLIETANHQGEHFSYRNIIKTLEECDQSATPEEIINELISKLETFCGSSDFADDLTMICLKKTEE